MLSLFQFVFPYVIRFLPPNSTIEVHLLICKLAVPCRKGQQLSWAIFFCFFCARLKEDLTAGIEARMAPAFNLAGKVDHVLFLGKGGKCMNDVERIDFHKNYDTVLLPRHYHTHDWRQRCAF